MSPMAKIVLEFIGKQKDNQAKNLAEMAEKRNGAIKEMTLAFWTEWYLEGYLRTEMELKEWMLMEKAITQMIADNASEEQIAKWVFEARAYYLRFVMQDFGISTSKGGNLVKDLRRQVHAGLVGNSSIDQNSLYALNRLVGNRV
jgi:hypothetical protein